jgi:hypothetical protein
MIERLNQPAAGDSYQVTYDGVDECGYVHARVDGLLLRGSTDPRPPVPTGEGTLVLDRVWDLSGGDGLGATGFLTLADGPKLTMEGGTEGKVFFTLGCAIPQ